MRYEKLLNGHLVAQINVIAFKLTAELLRLARNKRNHERTCSNCRVFPVTFDVRPYIEFVAQIYIAYGDTSSL